jgi:hypothetical protein
VRPGVGGRAGLAGRRARAGPPGGAVSVGVFRCFAVRSDLLSRVYACFIASVKTQRLVIPLRDAK